MITIFKYECNSKKIEKGQIFVAIKGLNVDGHDYINEAINNGAISVICEKDVDIDVPYIKVSNTKEYLKEILNKEYNETISKLKIIGITGTNGKTTNCYLTYQMLNLLGINTAYIGTLGYYYKDEHIILDNTTPDILNVYKLLVNSYIKGAEYVVMEISSQSLSYDRVHGIYFDIIGFTNLTRDHLDYHKTMNNYLNAKLKILDHLKDNAKIIVNSDDKYSYKFKVDNHEYLTFGLDGLYKIIDYKIYPNKSKLKFSYKNNIYDLYIPLTCDFNIYNYLMMLVIVNSCSNNINKIINLTSKLKHPKGRCETYKVNNGYAIIDYAHTPDAVEKIIESYKKLNHNRIITILGCGGNRDKTKRPIMGLIATSLSDYVIFTNDNPRCEDEMSIINDITNDLKNNNYEIILDRHLAIKKGINLMNKNDILLILGKGHETYQIIGKTKYHFDDSEEIKKFYKCKL